MANNGPKTSNSNLSSSFNSGLNTFGLNNSYGNAPPTVAASGTTAGTGTNGGYTNGSSGASSLNNSPQFNSTNNGLNYTQRKELPAWLQGMFVVKYSPCKTFFVKNLAKSSAT